MKPITFFSGLLAAGIVTLAARPVLAQQVVTPTAHATYTYVQDPPHLPGSGGNAPLVAAIQQQLVYPARAQRDGVTGKVLVSVSVDPEGNISNINVVRSLQPDCDSAAVAAIKRLPRLTPARQNNRAVYYSFALPVSFQPLAAPTKP